jgi:hypothetical protein
MRSNQHIDHLLNEWPFDPDGLAVRLVKGPDGRDLIQVRLDLGLLQMEVEGRPDGLRPEGAETVLHLLNQREMNDPDFELDDELCDEIDREFVQYYHRRVAWLRLQRFEFAVRDADHTLALMDFCKEHSPDEDWTLQHEQHRAFVIFHRTQAAAMAAISSQQVEGAIELIELGLEEIRNSFEDLGWEDFFESDELVERLKEFRQSLIEDFPIPKTLEEQLSEAVEAEQYELAALIRDKLARGNPKYS